MGVKTFFAVYFCKFKIRDAPDTVIAGYPANQKAGYPANQKAGYQISGRILGLTTTYIFGKISNKCIKTALTIIDVCKH
jgi:hypothetical protein